MSEPRLIKNVIITGKIRTVTGLHIGGNKGELKIGGTDNPIIADNDGRPYIPGSSLKGKMRSLLEFSLGKVKEDGSVHSCGDENCPICTIFGTSYEDFMNGPTRLIVRDARLPKGEKPEVELKTENVINRLSGKAAHPRTMERVPPGVAFEMEMVYGIYKEGDYDGLKHVFQAMSLLQDSYLGGSGSRGYGKVAFEDISLKVKTVEDYSSAGAGRIVNIGGKITFSVGELLSGFEEVKSKIME